MDERYVEINDLRARLGETENKHSLRKYQVRVLQAENAILREALMQIARGRLVWRGDHTEVEDVEDPASVAELAIAAADREANK